jgi:hypothetical protein
LEVLAMVEILQKEVIDIRADHNTKHDHLADLIATQVELSLSTSQSYVSRIDAFEKKIEDFLCGHKSGDDYNDDVTTQHPQELRKSNFWPIPDIRYDHLGPMPPLIPTEVSEQQPSSPLNRSVDKEPFKYHDQFDSLAPKVVPDTSFTASRLFRL